MRDTVRRPDIDEAIAKTVETLRVAIDIGIFRPHDPNRQHSVRRLDARMCVSSLPDGILPDEVRAFIYEELAEPKTLARAPGRHVDGAFRRRDAFLVAMIEHLSTLDFRPTRNDASRDKGGGYSAAGIVHVALKRLGVKLAERTIEDIWSGSRTNSAN
jgi:hypothetical protein